MTVAASQRTPTNSGRDGDGFGDGYDDGDSDVNGECDGDG